MKATFCFVDMAGFTALTEAHGDDAAAHLAMRLNEMVQRALGSGGRIVKSIGDAVLATMPTAAEAVAFVQRLWTACSREPDFPVLRAGLHYGEAVERGTDVFGAAVNLAARVAAEARGGQVLATAVVADAARNRRIPVTPLGRTALRNVREPVELFLLDLGCDARDAVVDPVCRMRVSPEEAAGHLRVEGVDYWFCSLDCATSFVADPDAYRRSQK
jgi:class 3 adenylate cyclase/YHS domain-containing protein